MLCSYAYAYTYKYIKDILQEIGVNLIITESVTVLITVFPTESPR